MALRAIWSDVFTVVVLRALEDIVELGRPQPSGANARGTSPSAAMRRRESRQRVVVVTVGIPRILLLE